MSKRSSEFPVHFYSSLHDYVIHELKSEGKLDLAQFIANRGRRAVDEAIAVGWELENVESTLQRSKMTRIEILSSKLEVEREQGCDGQWLQMAKEVFERNSIVRDDFAEAVRILLDKGRRKYRNLYLKGPCNCAKPFLLNPLNTMYKTFIIQPLQRLLGLAQNSQK